MALYGTEPFQAVLGRLKEARGMSYREIAEATARVDPDGRGLSPTRIAQLLKSGDPPAPRALELLAQALGQHPDVFVEYKLAQARAMLDERGPGGLEQAAWVLEAFTSVTALGGKPAPRSARRLAA
jgi:transcriptional regulator with XRE-family HTH domain